MLKMEKLIEKFEDILGNKVYTDYDGILEIDEAVTICVEECKRIAIAFGKFMDTRRTSDIRFKNLVTTNELFDEFIEEEYGRE
jgi:hypothetical protein